MLIWGFEDEFMDKIWKEKEILKLGGMMFFIKFNFLKDIYKY